jgi:ABC-2 type transport system ATP-binding protein
MTTKDTVLAVRDIAVTYGDFVAVDDVSFEVYGGEIFGLLGPNGAGKTSTLSAIEGLLKPQSGSVEIAGFDIFQEPLMARANLGVQLQSTSFQQELTVREIVELYAGLYNVPMSDAQADEILGSIQLRADGGKRAAQLSGGQQQRLALAVASLHNPPLVLLDEPTTGLDPQSRRQLWERIESMRDRGDSILLTTHSMEEASAVCDRVAIMDHGKILVTGGPEQLVEEHKSDPDVQAAARRGHVTLEDVFIGLTGKAVRN